MVLPLTTRHPPPGNAVCAPSRVSHLIGWYIDTALISVLGKGYSGDNVCGVWCVVCVCGVCVCACAYVCMFFTLHPANSVGVAWLWACSGAETMTIGNGNVFEVGAVCEATRVGDNNVFSARCASVLHLSSLTAPSVVVWHRCPVT
jgi:hypothetical protein